MFLYSRWLALPLNTRVAIARELGITKVGPTHVFNNTIQSDGYNIKDVENRITVEAIQNLLGVTSSDLNVLFDMMVSRANGTDIPVGKEVVADLGLTPAPVAPVVEAVKKPRKKKE